MLSLTWLYILAAIGITLSVASLAGLLVPYYVGYRERLEQHAANSLSELFVFMPVRSLGRNILLFALGIAAVVWLATGNMLSGIVSGGCALLMPWWLLRKLRRRRVESFHHQLPDALLLLSSSLRSGRALTASLQVICKEMPTPVAQEFTLVQRQVRIGQPLGKALDALFMRMPSIDLERVVIALKLAQESGGQQAGLLEQLSVTMRTKQQLQQRVLALTAQGRLQGKVMTALPLLMGSALWLIEKPTMQALSQHPLGWITTVVIILLLSAGYWVIRRLVQIEVPL
ncbi:type II secretion system F family protein [Aliidiomarina sp. Khilg15.8]